LIGKTPSRIKEFLLLIDESFHSSVIKTNFYLLSTFCNGVCMAAYGLEKAI